MLNDEGGEKSLARPGIAFKNSNLGSIVQKRIKSVERIDLTRGQTIMVNVGALRKGSASQCSLGFGHGHVDLEPSFMPLFTSWGATSPYPD